MQELIFFCKCSQQVHKMAICQLTEKGRPIGWLEKLTSNVVATAMFSNLSRISGVGGTVLNDKMTFER